MDLGATMVNPYRTKLGLPPLKDPLGADGNSEELAVYAVSEHLFQRPKQWPNHFRTVGFFFLDEEAWEPEESLKSFVVTQEKPIAITFGSMMHPDPAAMTSMILNAVATVGCRAVIQTGWTGLGASAESSSVLVTGFCPHSWLFPQSSLVVHHGGAGTTAAALRAGVPTVVIPHMLDQPVWGELSRASGCSRRPFD
jgi:sterol 3beta-glucosyltransferase